ncbi:hypothetical protein D3C81_1336140 [compost metagenome]
MDARCIKAGQPHITDDDQLERIERILKAFFQTLFLLSRVNVRPQQGLVRGTTSHDDLDRAFFRVFVVPFWTQGDDLVVQVHADLATHGHQHGFAGHLPHAHQALITLLKVRNQICRHAVDPRLGPDHLFQCGPTAFQARLLVILFIFSQFIDLIVDGWQLTVFQRQFSQPRFVVDGDRCTVFSGLLHVVDMNVFTEDRTGVAVFTGHRCAGKGHEGGIG